MNEDIKKERLQKHNYRFTSNFEDETWENNGNVLQIQV